MDKQALAKRIAEQLKAELEALVAEANRQIGMKQGAILELEKWRDALAPPESSAMMGVNDDMVHP
jgi:hypothetical protein